MQRNNNNNSVGAGGGVHLACAACKHQRKKCDEKCILAPYFPAEKSREFQAVHKVFGVSNATKIVRNANSEEDRRKVADSLIWEAFCRQKDPVLGPYGEYKKVYEELTVYKSQSQNQMMLLQVQGRDDHDHQVAHALTFKMAPTTHAIAEWNGSNYGTTTTMTTTTKRNIIDHHHVKGGVNNVALRYNDNQDLDGDSSLTDFGTFGYPNSHSNKSISLHEKSIPNSTSTANAATIVPLQYYPSDVAHINGKTLESTRWETIL